MNHRCANLPQPIDAATSLECRLRLRLGPRRGFTIVELLVVTAVAILLISILVLAVSGATRAAQKTNTIALMDSIKKGLIQFKEDIGYYPRVLNFDRVLIWSPDPDASAYEDDVQEWYSATSLADYLIGYGDHRQDGFGRVEGAASNFDWANETPPLGIRHPGPDGIWGAVGALNTRMGGPSWISEPGLPRDQGRVYGPYVDLTDQRLLAAIVGATTDGQAIVAFPGDPLPAGETWESLPKTIVDYWGRPIRYYRRPYPRGAIGQSYRAIDRNGDGIVDAVPTLSDFYYLRPFELNPREAKDTRFADDAGDTTTSHQLDAAEFALLSTGPDKKLTTEKRYDDPEYYNRDNIIEVGP